MALVRVKPKSSYATGAVEVLPPEAQERRFVEVPTQSKESSLTTRTGIVVVMSRRPTVDRAWVVEAKSEDLMIDLVVVEGKEDRKQVFDSMVKKHGGRA